MTCVVERKVSTMLRLIKLRVRVGVGKKKEGVKNSLSKENRASQLIEADSREICMLNEVFGEQK